MNTTTENTIENTTEKTSKHPFLKKVGILVLIIFILTYFSSLAGRYVTERNTLNEFVKINSTLTSKKVTIDAVNLNPYTQDIDIKRLTVQNPPNYISSYAIFIDEIKIKRSINTLRTFGQADKKEFTKQLFSSKITRDDITNIMKKTSETVKYYPEITLTKTTINYDRNSSDKTNLFVILNNIIDNLATDSYFSAMSVFDKNTLAKINYNGMQFDIGKLNFKETTIHIYENRKHKKTISLNDFTLDYTNLKQPTTYGHVLLASSIHAYDIIDRAVKSKT